MKQNLFASSTDEKWSVLKPDSKKKVIQKMQVNNPGNIFIDIELAVRKTAIEAIFLIQLPFVLFLN